MVPAKPKVPSRRRILQDWGYDADSLPNIDFLDAALCAVAAEAFREGRSKHFGRRNEGFIVIPAPISVPRGIARRALRLPIRGGPDWKGNTTFPKWQPGNIVER